MTDVVRVLAEEASAEAASIVVIDDDAESLLVVGSWGYPSELVGTWQRFPLDDELPLSEAARRGIAVYVPDVEALGERYPLLRSRPTSGGRALAAVPLRGASSGNVLGAVGLSYSSEQWFGLAQRQVILDAVERAQPHMTSLDSEALPEQPENPPPDALLVAVDAAADLVRLIDWRRGPDEVLDLVARTTQRLVGSDEAAVLSVTGHDVVLRGRSAWRAGVWRGLSVPLDTLPPLRSVIERGIPTVLAAAGPARSLTPDGRDLMRSMGVLAALHVPLAMPDGSPGLLVCSWRSLTAPDPLTLPVVQRFAEIVALGLRAARLEHQLLTAQTLGTAVRSPLSDGPLVLDAPAPPDAFQVGSAFRTATDELSGTFSTFLALADGTWGIALGDVSGADVEGAWEASLALQTLRSAARCDARPHRVLDVLNQEMVAREGFCNALFATLRPGPGGLRVAVARGGQPHPLVVRCDGTVTTLSSEGPTLGLFHEVELTEREAFLAPGDTLVCYTPGLVARWGTEAGKGMSTLHTTLGRLARAPVQQMVDAALDAVLEDAEDGEPRLGDAGLVGVRVTRSAG